MRGIKNNKLYLVLFLALIALLVGMLFIFPFMSTKKIADANDTTCQQIITMYGYNNGIAPAKGYLAIHYGTEGNPYNKGSALIINAGDNETKDQKAVHSGTALGRWHRTIHYEISEVISNVSFDSVYLTYRRGSFSNM